MANPLDQQRRQARTEKEAHKISGHHHGQGKCGKALKLPPQAQQRPLKTVADHQHEHAKEQGPRGVKYLYHSRRFLCVGHQSLLLAVRSGSWSQTTRLVANGL